MATDTPDDPLAMLAAWNRKGYYFTLASGGNYQPGDGVSCNLAAAGRTVCVCDVELDTEDHWSTVADVVREALRQWHADTTPKRFWLIWTDAAPGGPPPGLRAREWGRACPSWEVEVVAPTEAAAVEVLAGAYRSAGREPPTHPSVSERGPAPAGAE